LECKQGALWAIAQGFKVFPLVENGKLPAIKDWQEWAENSTVDKVTEFSSARPNCNWGLYCGASGLTVIDVDTKEGKVGLQSLDVLQSKHGSLPPTTVVITPTRGYHIYYKGECPSSVSTLAKDIDTRGVGGYVVLPFSVIDGKTYDLYREAPMPHLPNWVVSGVRAGRKEKKNLADGEMIETGERNNFLASFAGSMRERGASRYTILAALEVMNRTQLEEPLSDSELRVIADSISRYEPDQAVVASEFAKPVKVMAVTGDKVDFGAIKPRPWIMKDRYVGGIVSAIIAPGGAGKSTVALLDALAICTGKPLTGFDVMQQGNVWLYNTEDPIGELELRLAAMCVAHDITPKERAKLHITSGRDMPLVLAKKGKNGIAINEEAIKSAIAYIKDQDIKLLIVDPFVRSHEVDENDNMQIDKVIWCFQKIMDATGCAVCVVHHTNKSVYNASSIEEKMHSGRGASSLVYAARIAHVITTMREEDANRFNISEARRGWYIRLDNAKANLQAPAEKAIWFEKIGVDLMIGETVGAVKLANVTAVAEAFEAAERQRRRLDLGKALTTCGINYPSPIQDAYKKILANPKTAPLFQKRKSDRRAHEYLIELLKDEPLKYGGFIFTFLFREDMKVKNWIVADRDLDA